MEADLFVYFQRIEAAFCRQVGAPLLLSPLDFEKAAEWFAAGVAAEVVEEGIEQYFERLARRKVPSRRAICLSFAEPQILDALEAHRAAAVGRAAGVPERPERGDRVRRFLNERAEKMHGFAEDPERGKAMPVLSRFCAQAAKELSELVPRAEEAGAALEKSLAPLDREMGRLLMLEASPELVAAWRQRAKERLAAAGGGIDEEIIRTTADRLACQEGLRHFGLPRLSLLFLD